MSSRLTRDDVRALGLQILRGKPDPVVRVRLLRDVLCVGDGDDRLRSARAALEDSVHVTPLREQQLPDGSWGRLHSRDTSSAQTIPATEWAVERALAIGVDPEGPMLVAASRYLASIVEGRARASDPPERNDRWATGVGLFAAAALARIAPSHISLGPVWDLWHEIARRSFAGGSYSADAEADAQRVHLDFGNRVEILIPQIVEFAADKFVLDFRQIIVKFFNQGVEPVDDPFSFKPVHFVWPS